MRREGEGPIRILNRTHKAFMDSYIYIGVHGLFLKFRFENFDFIHGCVFTEREGQFFIFFANVLLERSLMTCLFFTHTISLLQKSVQSTNTDTPPLSDGRVLREILGV